MECEVGVNGTHNALARRGQRHRSVKDYQVRRVRIRTAVTQLAASCGEPLAAGGVGRTPRGGSTQRETPRGLDCGYRVPHLAR